VTRLLLYRHGAIGDSLTLTPFLHALRPRFDRIVLVGNAERLALIDERLRDEVLSWDLEVRRVVELAAGFDRSISFAAAPVPGFDRLLPLFPPEGENIYSWMRRLGVDLGGATDEYRPPPCHGRGLIIHSGAGSAKKNAPLNFFFGEAVKDPEGAVFLLGPAEDQVMEDRIRTAGFATERPETLAEMKRLILGHARFLGNDSGPAHLAALNGLETTVVFRTSDPATWAAPGMRVIRK
jgi:ADP-heptose:LPS heptosyltransferase